MSKRKIQINDNFNEINISNEIVLIKGSRTPNVDAWFKIAEDNLSSARVLFDNNRVNHAIFFIQQCVECIVKGIFLEAGVIREDKIKSINHNPSEAFEKLYEKIGYEQGLQYCRQIPEMFNKRSSFEEKFILGISLANQFTTAFNEFQFKIQSVINSLDTTRLESSIEEYNQEEKFYYQNILLLFSCLFTHKVEMDTRYFTSMNNGIVFPRHIFSTSKIVERLPSFIRLLTTLKDYFVGLNNEDHSKKVR